MKPLVIDSLKVQDKKVQGKEEEKGEERKKGRGGIVERRKTGERNRRERVKGRGGKRREEEKKEIRLLQNEMSQCTNKAKATNPSCM